MGYDDNTPLTGVTGAGLPAEIWHETMVRVHEGLPARPLPMMAPVPSTQPQEQTPRTDGQGRTGGDINNVLRGLFGADNR